MCSRFSGEYSGYKNDQGWGVLLARDAWPKSSYKVQTGWSYISTIPYCSLKLKWLASYSCRWKNKTELFDLNLLCKKKNLPWMVLTYTHFFSVLEIELRASYSPGTLPLSYIPSPKFWLFQSMVPSWWPIQSIWPQQADEPKVAHLCQTPWVVFISRVIYLLFPIRASDTSTKCIFGLLQWKPSICLLSIFLLLRHSGLNDTDTHSDKAG